MIFGPNAPVHDTQQPLCLTLALQKYFNKYKKTSETSPEKMFCGIPESRNSNISKVSKKAHAGNS